MLFNKGQFPAVKYKPKHVLAHEAYEILSTSAAMVVLDVRMPKEIAMGHIEGVLFVDFKDDEFEDELSKLDRETPYLVHCKAGGRSEKALKILEEHVFNQIVAHKAVFFIQ